jgi:hypothetical protein
MQIIKSFFKTILFLLPFASKAQTTYLPQGAKEYQYLDRLDILQYRSGKSLFTTCKPYSRKEAMDFVLQEDTITSTHLPNYDEESLIKNNIEWAGKLGQYYKSKHPVLNRFYVSPANFFEVNQKDFFLAVNPVISVFAGKQTDNDQLLYLNARGVTLRGTIANRIGFSSTIVDNQERGPDYFKNQVLGFRAVPGVGFYKLFKADSSAYDYFDGRGYLTFKATKYIDFQFGYDKNFIGNGYRSLFLSDWGNSYLFAKINTKIWKLNYENLYMELMPQYAKKGDSLLRRKYAAMHHLSINVTRWLNVGLFEGVMFGRKDHFDFQYLNPIIFYRHIEGTIGSPDNAVAGIDFKANVKKRVQVYGQLLLDEFILSKIKNTPTYWANKFGFQLGGKYINAFGVDHLDLQAEINRVRPFTYSHNDTINNYTHYNQPLAHPLGANFQEFVGIIRYRPHPQWNLYARCIAYYKGLDSANTNFGGNIFRNYNTRLKGDGFTVGSGDKYSCVNLLLNLSYEFRQNLYFELGMQYRNDHLASTGISQNSTMITAGIRLNWYRREYDF